MTGSRQGQPVDVLVVDESQGRNDIPVPLVFSADGLYSVALRVSFVQRAIYATAQGNIALLAEIILDGQVITLLDIVRTAFGRVVIVPSGSVKGVAYTALAARDSIGRCGQRPFFSERLRIAQGAAYVFGVAVRGVAHTAGVHSGSGREHGHFFARSAVCAISDIAADPDGAPIFPPKVAEGEIGVQIHPLVGTDAARRIFRPVHQSAVPCRFRLPAAP